MPSIEVFTDGACQYNPGLGGWGAYIILSEKYSQNLKKTFYSLWGGSPLSTNNKMELQAPLEALKFLKNLQLTKEEIVVYSDSQYVVKGITSWIYGWQKNKWLTAQKKPVENKEIWEKLFEEQSFFTHLSWQWIRGHSTSEGNHRAHCLAQQGLSGKGLEQNFLL